MIPRAFLLLLSRRSTRHPPDKVKKTLLERTRDFAEEFTFFINRIPVKKMPDVALLMLLRKVWIRRKNRRISKKSKPEKLYCQRHKSPECDKE